MSSRLEEEAPAPVAEDQTSETSEKSWEMSGTDFLLVMITFIATVSFQAGTNPPGGVWQENLNPRLVGKSIMATEHPSQFVTFTAGVTVAMVVSAMQVFVLMNELPYKKLSVSKNFLYAGLGLAFTSMGFAYWSSVTALTPSSQLREITVTMVTVLISGGVGLAILIYIQKKRRLLA